MKKKIEVVIIYFENKILCVQRPKINSYISLSLNFQVGIEQGETKKALKRELLEERYYNIKSLFLTVTHQYPDFELTMHSLFVQQHLKNSS
jgi:8-oxo-dGTP diphosphatase